MKNKGCSLSGPPILGPNRAKKISKSKHLRNFDILGAIEIRGCEKVRFFTAKGTSLREYTSFEPFCVKLCWGLTLRAERGKSQKVSDSHRNDVSPLTQGLRYRAACDTYIDLIYSSSLRWERSARGVTRGFDISS